jgi:hypothetical protein
LLGFWVAGFLGCWVSGLLGFWVSGFLGFWVAAFWFLVSGFQTRIGCLAGIGDVRDRGSAA